MTENQKRAAENRVRNQRILKRDQEIAAWVSEQPKRPINPTVDANSMYPSLAAPVQRLKN